MDSNKRPNKMKINRWKLLIVAAVVSIATGACTDERDNFMVDDTVSFVGTDQVATTSIYSNKYDLAILKNGKGRQGATVRISVSEEALNEYNTAHGTDFVAMPAQNYKFSATSVTFSKSDTRKFIEITWTDAAMGSLDMSKRYVIPCVIEVVDAAVGVSENRGLRLVELVRASVSMKETAAQALMPSADRKTVSYEGSIVIDPPIPTIDVTVNLAIDNSLIEAYNEANGTDYKAVPEGFVTLAAPSTTIAGGATSATFTYQINSGALFDGNKLKQEEVFENKYLAPVRIRSVSKESVGITNGVMYVPFTMNMELKGPWPLLEGEDNCYARDPLAPGWASGYIADKLFDGKVGVGVGEEWISQWEKSVTNTIQFPMTFVLDLGQTRVFSKFRKADYTTHQGQYRDFRFYTAETYDGANTVWNLVADATTEFNWASAVVWYDIPVKARIAGRYLKVEIVKPSFALDHADYLGGRGKLADIQGEGF